jgi:hypothetical protein
MAKHGHAVSHGSKTTELGRAKAAGKSGMAMTTATTPTITVKLTSHL